MALTAKGLAILRFWALGGPQGGTGERLCPHFSSLGWLSCSRLPPGTLGGYSPVPECPTRLRLPTGQSKGLRGTLVRWIQGAQCAEQCARC